MINVSRRTIAAIASACGLAAMLGIATGATAAENNRNIAQMLRTGGLVIVVRHGATFSDQADTDPLNFDNIAAQRRSSRASKR